jgi:small neutral amino acid transporter SnatA (MarC family)
MTEPHEHRDHEHHEHHEHHSLTEALAERPALSAILFDLRSVIGLLFVVYGLVLTILGIIGETPEQLAKAGGIALNLWVGIAMLIGGAIFYTWAFMKPPQPPTRDELAEIEEGGPMHMGGHH